MGAITSGNTLLAEEDVAIFRDLVRRVGGPNYRNYITSDDFTETYEFVFSNDAHKAKLITVRLKNPSESDILSDGVRQLYEAMLSGKISLDDGKFSRRMFFLGEVAA